MEHPQDEGETFGGRLRRFRKGKGYSQELLGQMVGGLTKSAVAQWEGGHNYPSREYLPLIASALGVTMNELLGTPDDQGDEIQVFPNQTWANDYIRAFIEKNKPSEIFLIQYSSSNVNEIIQEFFRYAPPKSSPQMYLLIKYPGIAEIDKPQILEEYKQLGVNTVEASLQYIKIKGQLGAFIHGDKIPPHVTVHIRCYHAPGAMRAVYIGHPRGEELRKLTKRPTVRTEQGVGLLSMSMYRYTGRPGGVVGVGNPLIHVKSNSESGRLLCDFFEETFVDLWNDSREGKRVLTDIEEHKKRSR